MAHSSILIIDRDETRQESLRKKVLAPAGYEVQFAATTRAITSSPDLILLSASSAASLQGQLLELAHSQPATPVLVLAGPESDKKFTDAALKSGAYDTLVAPFHARELLEAVRRGIGRRERLQAWADEMRAASLEEIQRAMLDIEAVSEAGRAVTSTLDLDEVLMNVVKTAVEVSGAEEGSLLLLDPASQELYMRAGYNFQDSFARTLRLQVKDSLAGQVMQTRQPMLLDQDTPEKIKTHYLVHSLIYLPLIVHDQAIGVLGVDNRSKKDSVFSKKHVAVLSTLADYAAVAIENATLFERAETEARKLENMVQAVADGVVVVDGETRVILINEPAREILQIPEQACEGARLADLLDLPELVDCVIDREQTSTRRIEIEPESGRHFIAIIHLLPGVGKTITIQDVTHYKELDRIKSDFITAISHDLRSPLTAILGYVELINRVGEINPQQRAFIEHIQAGVHNITDLIDSLLELGRVEADFDLAKEVVQLPVILRYAVESIEQQVRLKEHSVRLDIPPELPPILGHPFRLRQMVGNLLENASKYSPPGGVIELRCRREGAQIVLQVRDEGIGIPASEIPFIFDKMYRASNVPGESEGTGIGLSIVKSIAEKHGGRVWCESSPGKGTTFTIVLPVYSPPEV